MNFSVHPWVSGRCDEVRLPSRRYCDHQVSRLCATFQDRDIAYRLWNVVHDIFLVFCSIIMSYFLHGLQQGVEEIYLECRKTIIGNFALNNNILTYLGNLEIQFVQSHFFCTFDRSFLVNYRIVFLFLDKSIRIFPYYVSP